VTSPPEPRSPGFAGFRAKLLVAMMLVVSAVAAAVLLFAQRNVAENVRRDFQREFQGELAALHAVQDIRHAVLAERCRALARRPRIHAALEDNALDLLYPSARDELLGVMDRGDGPSREPGTFALRARFYRFLDGKGRVIPPPDAKDVGELRPGEESQLDLGALPDGPQVGYMRRGEDGAGGTIDEVIAMPIISSEDGEIISAIVLGFKPAEFGGGSAGIKSGILLNGRLDLPSLPASVRQGLAGEAARAIAAEGRTEGGYEVRAGGAPYLLFCKRLNPGSLFPAAYEVSIYPLAESLARQRQLVWQFAGGGALLLLGAFAASHLVASRLSKPVEKLAEDSEENRAQRYRAEAALESTSRELQRSARFSADASHQLKTPVTVLRAGLEELLAGETLSAEAREEVSALVHQTFRLAGVIEDLLLLSRMDAGRLQIQFSRLNLTPLIEAWLDDLGALPDALGLKVEADYPPSLWITGEKRYATLILQNLLENARKYNRAGGRIRITAREAGGWAILSVGNSGQPVPAEAREHIFERFHRGSVGENIPGHGIGLSLAKELARLHGGDLRLSRSDEEWTEFEVRFQLARASGEAGATG
jgi:signal transduction histidine kinase